MDFTVDQIIAGIILLVLYTAIYRQAWKDKDYPQQKNWTLYDKRRP